jgi:DNA helicase-2/ATP-dependent DNA helicase PcrA
MTDYNDFCKEFVKHNKSLIIAPAGHGKTFTISECLKYTKGKQLILTHTHAGIASIKSKLLESQTNCPFSIETISSFAQKYVEAFDKKDQIPDQDNRDYFTYLIKRATELLKILPIKKVIQASYKGVFVDEYQDCTISQHEMIMSLGLSLPLHILGDPLQGIFSFNDERLVDFNTDLKDFKITGELNIPWRWKNTNPQLGETLMAIRKNIESNSTIDLSTYKNVRNFYFLQCEHDQIHEEGSTYRKWLNGITFNEKKQPELDNVLIITPTSHSIWVRVDLNKSLSYKYYLLEAFDEKDFYSYAKEFDNILQSENIYHDLMLLLKGSLIRKGKIKTRSSTLLTGLGKYFKNENEIPRPIRKNPDINKLIIQLSDLETSKDKRILSSILLNLKYLDDVVLTRKELYYDLCKAIKQASLNNSSILDEMKHIRDIKRRIGRKTRGKYIGTTLLTKGLEYDTVVLLDADRITNPKHFYVAITRAIYKLVVFTNTTSLSFKQI